MIEFQVSDFQPEVKTEHLWYASMGSGQPIADPLLGLVREAFWKDGVPDIKQGLFAATFVLYLACSMAPGGVAEPIQMGVIERDPENKGRWKARRLSANDLHEHTESVKGAIKHLGRYESMSDAVPDMRERGTNFDPALDASPAPPPPAPPKP